jgi:hypothetical protein
MLELCQRTLNVLTKWFATFRIAAVYERGERLRDRLDVFW